MLVASAAIAGVTVASSMSSWLTGQVLVTALDTATTGAISLVSREVSDPETSEVLAELDVDAKLRTIKALISGVKLRYPHLAAAEKSVKGETTTDNVNVVDDYVEVCLQSVSDIVTQISSTLETIHEELDYHATKFFSSWRSPSVKVPLARLRKQCKVLDTRLDLLVKCLAVAGGTTASTAVDIAQTGRTGRPPQGPSGIALPVAPSTTPDNGPSAPQKAATTAF